MSRRRQRFYLDTSVLGGCFDREFEDVSRALVRDAEAGRFQPVLSEVMAAEVSLAPEPVRDVYAHLAEIGAEVISVSAEAIELAREFEGRGILSPRFRNDMLHIALAIVADVDVLVSWNFKHIVRLDKIRLFNGVGLENGYRSLQIYSPREVIFHGNDEN